MHNFIFVYQVWNRTWQTYLSVTQVVYSGAQDLIKKKKKKKKKKNHIFADEIRVDYFSSLHIVHKYEELTHTVILW